MLIQSLFFVGLNGIKLPAVGNPGIELRDRLRGVTERESIARIIGAYEEMLGSVETAHLLRTAPAIIVRRESIDIDPDQIGDSINGALIRSLAVVHNWISSLWLIKDHAVDVDVGWMAVRIGDEITVNNNRWAEVVSKASGSMSPTSFNNAELKDAAKVPISADFWSKSGPISLNIEAARDPATTKLTAGSLRFQRFLYFIHAGRTTRDVAIKIAHWCSGLEALVSSSQSELSHQVAERAASALYAPGPERLMTFRLIKQAYGMRSKAVHGASFKTKDERQLLETVAQLDDICRTLARLYFRSSTFKSAIESDSDTFNEFWLEKIML